MLWGFSDRAQYLLKLARDEAGERGHDYLGAEHILVGLVRAGGAGVEALGALGVDTIELIAVCRGQVSVGAHEDAEGPLPFDSTAREVIQHAIDAMRESAHRSVASGHVLLGVYRAGGRGREVLCLVGIGSEDPLRSAVLDALESSSELSEDVLES